MHENLKKGDIILLPLSHSDLVTDEVRPVLVLYHDLKDLQLVVSYITTQLGGELGPFERLILKGTPTFEKSGFEFLSAFNMYISGLIIAFILVVIGFLLLYFNMQSR